MFTYKDLVKPIIMDCNHLDQIDDDYVYSSKVDGVRCLIWLENGVEYRDYGYRVDTFPSEYEGPLVYMDVEDLGYLLVLDVLYNGKSLIHLPLELRLRHVPVGWAVQQYVRARNVKTLDIKEGVVAQRESAPYGVEVLRLKYRETGDFLVKQGKAMMGPPCVYDYPCVDDLSEYENKIVELYLDTNSFFRVRVDKLEPNSSVVIARSVAEYRAFFPEFYGVLDSVAPHKDDFRDSVVIVPRVFKPGTYQWHVQSDLEPEKHMGSPIDIYEGQLVEQDNDFYLTSEVSMCPPLEYERELNFDVILEKKRWERRVQSSNERGDESLFETRFEKKKKKIKPIRVVKPLDKPYYREKDLSRSHPQVFEKNKKKQELQKSKPYYQKKENREEEKQITIIDLVNIDKQKYCQEKENIAEMPVGVQLDVSSFSQEFLLDLLSPNSRRDLDLSSHDFRLRKENKVKYKDLESVRNSYCKLSQSADGSDFRITEVYRSSSLVSRRRGYLDDSVKVRFLNDIT